MTDTDRVENAQRLKVDDEFRKSFLEGLHTYLKSHMIRSRKRWTCGCDRMDDPAHKIYSHFIGFCNTRDIEWTTAHQIFREKYGEFYCDCDYLEFEEPIDKTVCLN